MSRLRQSPGRKAITVVEEELEEEHHDMRHQITPVVVGPEILLAGSRRQA
jgi:hypothetical protein